MVHPIGKKELWHAQLIFALTVILQFTIPQQLRVGNRWIVAIVELILIGSIGISAPKRHISFGGFNRTVAVLLIGVVSLANLSSLALVINGLMNGSDVPGKQLIAAAFAIFVTNIIAFSLWYWEVDSPGLTGIKKHDADPKFDFASMRARHSQPGNWEPTYFDYLYLSMTNSSTFGPTDSFPLTHGSKLLMGSQSLISLLTVVIVTARAVGILG